MGVKIKRKEEDVQRASNNGNLLNLIISETLCRDFGVSSKEFMEKLGFKDSEMSEDKAVNIALFNICMEYSKQLIFMQNKLAKLNGVIKEFMTENDIKEEK